ncbi:MAG: MFS transporter [Firmicutes bacterium]|nr:MFS transporter [Bacillota bacterium]
MALSLSDLRSPHRRDPRRWGMLVSAVEGCSFNVWMTAMSGNFLTGLALFLGAGGLVIGVLGSLPALATLLQVVAAPLVAGLERRREFMALLCGIQRMGAPLAGLVALWLGPSPAALALLVAAHLLGWLCMAPAVVVWQGYMSDLVPPEIRGRYFAARYAWGLAVSTAATLTFGAVLDYWQGATGFRILSGIALVAGAANVLLWLLHPQVPQAERRQERPFWEALRVPLARPGVHRRVAGFLAAWAFAQGLAVPFYPMVLLDHLGLSFSAVSWLNTAATLLAAAALRYWGRRQDQVGPGRNVGVLTGMLAAAPLLMVAARYAGWPVLVAAQVLHGVAFNAMTVAQQTLTMELAPTSERAAYFGLFAAASGLTGFLTPVLAGPLADHHWASLFAGAGLASAALSLLWRARIGSALGRQAR